MIDIKKIIIGLIGMLTLGACSDFLEEQSQDEVIVPVLIRLCLRNGVLRPAILA